MKQILIWILGVVTMVAVFSCSKTAVREEPSPYKQFQQGMNYFQKGDYLKAQKELQKVIYGYPGQTFIDTAQYYLALSYFNISSYPEAIGEFRKLLQTFPTSALADDSQYYVALSYFKQSPPYYKDQTDSYSAVDEFGVFLDRYPDSPLVGDARGKLDLLYDKLAQKLFKSGELYLKLNDYDPALIYFGQVRDNYSNTQWAAFAVFYSGVALMNQKKTADALETFQNFVSAFPDHKLVKKAQKNISKLGLQGSAGS
jgi:outer membrane protein assembly factor BamD